MVKKNFTDPKVFNKISKLATQKFLLNAIFFIWQASIVIIASYVISSRVHG